MNIIIANHAQLEIARRQLSIEAVRDVAQNPHKVIELRTGRKICQSKYHDSVEDREMLLRVICEEAQSQLVVITAYRTSKIDKYWVKED